MESIELVQDVLNELGLTDWRIHPVGVTLWIVQPNGYRFGLGDYLIKQGLERELTGQGIPGFTRTLVREAIVAESEYLKRT
jgi:hypothetical protein